MRRIKKLLVIIVAVMLSFTLQFRTTLSRGMESGFSLSQLAKNLFMKKVFAYTDYYYNHDCSALFPNCRGVYCSAEPMPIACLYPYVACDCWDIVS